MQCGVEQGPPLNPSEESEVSPEEMLEEELREIENVLAEPDVTTDVILEVEGRELHANRAVLAHYSPFFHSMFYSNFKEKSTKRVPLPGKTYDTMVTFFNLLYPRSVSAECLINDSNLIGLLTLGDEYQADKVLALVQNYIGEQLFGCFHRFYRYSVQEPHSVSVTPSAFYSHGTVRKAAPSFSIAATSPQQKRGQQLEKKELIQKLTLYLQASDVYRLPAHRDVILSLLVDLATCLDDVTQLTHYSALPQESKMDLVQALCRKLDGSRLF